MVAPLIAFIKLWVHKSVQTKTYDYPLEMQYIFGTLSQIITVRGYKTVVKFFPHEVSDMEPVTEMLQHVDFK
jgi:hypothetical protein